MKTIKALLLVLVALAVAMPAAAQPSRLYDKDVKQVLDQSKQTYERFWDALDYALKNTTFKGPAGEFVVKKIDEDYRKVVDTARERFNDSYSASTEVAAILRDSVRTQTYVTQKGSGMKGASEWQAHTTVLGQLAAEYGGAFPPAENQALRRYNDKEVVLAATGIEQASKQLAGAVDSALKKDKATPEAARKSLGAEVNRLGETAKAFGSTINYGRPASAQVTALFDQSAKARGAVAGSSAASAVQGQWSGIDEKLAIIATAFHQK